MMSGQYLKHDPHAVYLGITLDCTMRYKVAIKVKSHNDLTKRAGSSWGANTLAVCYSLAQSCHIEYTSTLAAQFHDVSYHWDHDHCLSYQFW